MSATLKFFEMAAKGKSRRVVIELSEEEHRLAKQLAARERRTKLHSVDLWARDVVRQYLHEFKVMPEAWKE